MYYIIQFEFYDSDKHLNITKFETKDEALNRLLYFYFNHIIIANPQRHNENVTFALECQCFDHNIT